MRGQINGFRLRCIQVSICFLTSVGQDLIIKQLDNWITQELVIENGFFFHSQILKYSLVTLNSIFPYNLGPLRPRVS